MNKKKILLSTAIATTMLISGIAMPKTLASTEANQDVRTSTFQVNDSAYTITVALPKLSQEQVNNIEYPTLTKDDVVDMIKNEKFANPSMDVKFDDKAEKSGTVGTNSKITINDKDFSVVLYGDLNGDGKVNLIDASMIYNYHMDNNSVALSDLAKKAGDIITTGQINLVDAAAIYNSVMGSFDAFSKTLLPDDNIIVIDADIEEAIENLDTTMYDVALDGETINVTIKDEEATLSDVFDDALDTFLGSELFDTMLEEAINGYANIDDITVHYGNTTKTYKEMMENEQVKNLLNQIKNGDTSKVTLKSLVKIAVGQDKIDEWKEKPIKDLLDKSGITIDVKLQANDNVLLNNFELEKIYTINFYDIVNK